ncbi:MAG: recombination protein NinB [Gammaproteobacteria bacterium]|nr:recombination protein NinB [Gammaproteobacteria bacterium]
MSSAEPIRWNVHNRAELINWWKVVKKSINAEGGLSLSGGCTVEIKPKKINRSAAQNRLFHMWVKEIAVYVSKSGRGCWSPEAWKQYLKSLFIEIEILDVPGGSIQIRRGSSQLSKREFAHFLEQIEAKARSDWNIPLTCPDDIYRQAMGVKRHG